MNILVVLYLALAPGMDVSQLLKSVGLCEFFETQIRTDPCGHGEVHVKHFHSNHCLSLGLNHTEESNHEDPKDSEDSKHHHHNENIVVETGVISATSMFVISTSMAVFGVSRELVLVQLLIEQSFQQAPRAPPWVRHIQTVKLLV
ncbi:MAG: hypothetical protein V3V10_09880 [Planctomycetota bacterium]